MLLGWLFLQCSHLVTTSDFVSLNWLFVAQLQSWSSLKTSTGPSWLLSANTTGTDSFLSHTLAKLCCSVFTHPLGPVIMTSFSKSLLNLHCMRPQAWWTTMEWLNDRNAQHIKSIRTFHHISHYVFQQYLFRAYFCAVRVCICASDLRLKTLLIESRKFWSKREAVFANSGTSLLVGGYYWWVFDWKHRASFASCDLRYNLVAGLKRFVS
jgi:hypothetical protein